MVRSAVEVGVYCCRAELERLRIEQVLREYVNGDHAATRRRHRAEQPGPEADQESRAHLHMVAAGRLSAGKVGDKPQRQRRKHPKPSN